MNDLIVPRSLLPVRGATMPVLLFAPGGDADSIVGPFTTPDGPAGIADRMIRSASWFIHPHELWSSTTEQLAELNDFRECVRVSCADQGIRLCETKPPGERMTVVFGQAREVEIVPTDTQIQRSISAVHRYRVMQQPIPTASQAYALAQSTP